MPPDTPSDTPSNMPADRQADAPGAERDDQRTGRHTGRRGGPATALEETLDALAARRPSLIDLGLARMERTLARLGDPHEKLPPVFHVAGTNGKGSTCAFLRAILEASGARAHAFASPHLVRYNERIVLAGREIGDEAFIDALARTDAAAGDDDLTFFETLTAAAFLAFAETPADYLVLEVGLGGRLDSTNVVRRPAAALVAAVGLDHQRFLGETLDAIAMEKAGVFKRDAPAVIGAQEPAAMAVLAARAEAAGARVFAYGTDWTAWPENGRLIYQDTDGLSDLAPPRLAGAHQYQNAGLAIAGVKAAGLGLSDAILSEGIARAVWPARFQPLREGPLVELLRGARDGGHDSEVWLDGGHNPHAAAALAAATATLEERDPKPLVLIAGMQEGKDAAGFFAPFADLARAVVTTRSPHPKALPPEALADAARTAKLKATPADDLRSAAREARALVDGPARFLICGSLYLAGEVLAENR